MVSIIIPYHNEGKEFIVETLSMLYDTIDVKDFEVIIVDDGSDKKLRFGVPSSLRVIRHLKNLGVGAAFDTGVSAAKGEYIFLMGCDILFEANNWASNMIAEIDSHPKSLICSSVVGYWDKDKKPFAEARKKPTPFLPDAWIDDYWGAFLRFTNEDPNNPSKGKTIIDAIWNCRTWHFNNDQLSPFVGTVEIPCILGAFYGTTKKWYQHLDGFWGHKKWGTLEAYISLKSHLFGGRCYATSNVITGHLFKSNGTHGTALEYIHYNKILVAWLLFNDTDRDKLLSWYSTTDNELKKDLLEKANKIIEENKNEILEKREEYRKKTVFDIDSIVKKFKIKF